MQHKHVVNVPSGTSAHISRHRALLEDAQSDPATTFRDIFMGPCRMEGKVANSDARQVACPRYRDLSFTACRADACRADGPLRTPPVYLHHGLPDMQVIRAEAIWFDFYVVHGLWASAQHAIRCPCATQADFQTLLVTVQCRLMSTCYRCRGLAWYGDSQYLPCLLRSIQSSSRRRRPLPRKRPKMRGHRRRLQR
jgi:hypothetical protein